MSITAAPRAVRIGRRLVRSETGRFIAGHQLRFQLTTEPDQYRVTWTHRTFRGQWRALVHKVTLTEREFLEWEQWLDNRHEGEATP